MTTSHYLLLPDDLTAGSYTLQAVVYDQGSGRRLSLLVDDSPEARAVATLAGLDIGRTSATADAGPRANEPLCHLDGGISPAAHELISSCGQGDEEIEVAVRSFRSSGSARHLIEGGLREMGTVFWRTVIDVAPVADGVYRVTYHRLEGDAPIPPSLERLLVNLQLLETTLPRTSFAPGEVVRVETTWQNSLRTGPDVGQFLHLLDQEGKLVVQRRSALRFYREGEQGGVAQIRGTETLNLLLTLPPGPYQLVAGLYSTETGWRVPFSTRTEIFPAGSLLLDTIWIE